MLGKTPCRHYKNHGILSSFHHEKRSNIECGGAMRIGLSHRFCRATGLSLVGCLLAPYAADNFAFGATVDSSRTVGTTYTEDLSLERLGQHHVAAKFLFRSEWVPQDRHRCQDHEDWLGQKVGADATARREGEGKLCHFEAVFPREIGVLLDKFKASRCCRMLPQGGLFSYQQQSSAYYVLVAFVHHF